MSLAPFRIRTEPGRAKITVNDLDISDQVAAYQLTQGADEIARLQLVLHAEGLVEGEGIVEVVREASDLSAVAEWIRGLDPDILRAQAANATGLGGNTTKALLEIVADMLQGGVT